MKNEERRPFGEERRDERKETNEGFSEPYFSPGCICSSTGKCAVCKAYTQYFDSLLTLSDLRKSV